MKLSPLEAYEAESKLSDLALQTFARYQFYFVPLFPNVLVRVLDPQGQDRKVGSIISPQNAARPYYKAVVLRTWQQKEIDGTNYNSELQPGDIVEMPYWGGIPLDPYGTDDSVYRVVPENKLGDYKKMKVFSIGASQEHPHIFAKAHLYDPEQVALELATKISLSLSKDKQTVVKEILASYIIMPK